MNTKLTLAGSISLGLLVASASFAKPAATPISVVRGSLEVRAKDGSYNVSKNPAIGQWVKSSSSDTTILADGLTVRMAKGSEMLVASSQGNEHRLEAKSGRIYVRVPAGSKCVAQIGSQQLRASEGEFVLDAAASDLYVFEGQATFVGEQAAKVPSLINWENGKKQLALDGPDVRRRGNKRKRFTQGEENKGKRIGEDQPPTSTASPAITESPAYTPTASPSVTVSPTTNPPSPSPSPSAQAGGGGGQIWPYFLGAGILGGGAAIIANNGGGGDDGPRFVAPASP